MLKWILHRVSLMCGSFVYLQVFEDVKTDPVFVRIWNETQAHVGGGVVEITNQVHCSRTAFWTQHGIQLSGPDDLIGICIWHGTTGRQTTCHEDLLPWATWPSLTALPECSMGEAAVQIRVYVSAALLCGPRVGQHHQDWQKSVIFHFFLLHLLQQFSNQVHSRQLVAMGTATHDDPWQPWQTHRLDYLHLTGCNRNHSREEFKKTTLYKKIDCMV